MIKNFKIYQEKMKPMSLWFSEFIWQVLPGRDLEEFERLINRSREKRLDFGVNINGEIIFMKDVNFEEYEN